SRAAWERHGIRYPGAGERIAAVEEAVGIVRALWRGESVDHEGRAFTLRGASLAPRPVQRPGPPVWIAAMKPRALALAARCADGWEASYVTPRDFAARSARLDVLAADAGRALRAARPAVGVRGAVVRAAAGGGGG